MKHRCSNPANADYARYGGRGIQVEYKDFSEFLADVGLKPEGTSIERRDNEKGYGSGNCYWATPAQQARNTRSTKLSVRNAQLLTALFTAKASDCTVVHFADVVAPLFGIKPKTVFNVIYGRQWL